MSNDLINYVFSQTHTSNLIVPMIVSIFASVITYIIARITQLYHGPADSIRLQNIHNIEEIINKFKKIGLNLGIISRSRYINDPYAIELNRHSMISIMESISQLFDLLSRLPMSYIEKHDKHIGETCKYLGYIRAIISVALRDPSGISEKDFDTLEKFCEHLGDYDTYFLVYDTPKYKRVPLYKKIFYRKPNYENSYSKKENKETK